MLWQRASGHIGICTSTKRYTLQSASFFIAPACNEGVFLGRHASHKLCQRRFFSPFFVVSLAQTVFEHFRRGSPTYTYYIVDGASHRHPDRLLSTRSLPKVWGKFLWSVWDSSSSEKSLPAANCSLSLSLLLSWGREGGGRCRVQTNRRGRSQEDEREREEMPSFHADRPLSFLFGPTASILLALAKEGISSFLSISQRFFF